MITSNQPAGDGAEAAAQDTATASWPRFQSHKVVEALKIADIVPLNNVPDGSGWTPSLLHFEEPGFAPLQVDAAWLTKHTPHVGGYLVRYAGDGYLSWSPADAFEGGYAPYQEPVGDEQEQLDVGTGSGDGAGNAQGSGEGSGA